MNQPLGTPLGGGQTPTPPPPSPPGPPQTPAPKSTGWAIKSLFILAAVGTVLMSLVAFGIFLHFSSGLPKIITVEDYRPLGVSRIMATREGKDGKREDVAIGEFFKERRYLVPYEKIPEILVRAFISAEDDRFFEHPGINVASMLRASIANFRAGHVVQGGSTITQQVAKSLLLTPERSFVRKIKEVILASRIEHNLTKQQILYLYLNQIYLGHGAYGVQAASQTYFRKDVSELSLAEAALLAGMPQAPGKYSPLLNPDLAKKRQLYVLRRMYENKYISQAQMAEAAAQRLRIYHDEDLNMKYAAYLVEYLRKYLAEKYGEKALYEDGLTVTIPTTVELTQAAQKSLRDGLEAIDKRIGYRGPQQHLRPEEIEGFSKDLRLKLIERKIHHQMFMPDGHMDPIEAMREEGITSDAQLLDVGETYEGVVTAIDDKKKMVTVMIGDAKADMPLEKMKWAHTVKDDKNPNPYHSDPSAASRVVKKGDVVLARVFENSAAKGLIVGLDQEPQVQGALFSMEAQTGYVLAMEGGYDFERSEFNRAVQAQRQPGSSFKPIIYGAALEKGYTPASIIIDSPIVYEDSQSGKWKPSNFEEKFYGDTTFRQALIKSRNVPTIKIVQSIQVPYLIEYAKRLGMNAQFNADLSISLGSAAVSLMEITKVYSLFPRLGRKVAPIFFTKIVDRDGRVIEEQKPKPLPQTVKIPAVAETPSGEQQQAQQANSQQYGIQGRALIAMPTYPPQDDPDQVLDPRVAYVMTHLMKEVVNYGTGHEAKSLGKPAAGKTGTTNDYIDAWFMGFTPFVVTGVWVGFDSQKTIGQSETGARAALPIWLGYMREAVKKYPDSDFTIPPGVVFAKIDETTGKLALSNSSASIEEAFIEGTQPTEATTSAGTKPKPATQGDFFKEDIE